MPGYSSDRSDAEKKNDKDIDRAYRSTIKGHPDAEKNLIRGAVSVRLLHQRRQRTSNNYHAAAASRRRGPPELARASCREFNVASVWGSVLQLEPVSCLSRCSRSARGLGANTDLSRNDRRR
jgi:hypothetical protein